MLTLRQYPVRFAAVDVHAGQRSATALDGSGSAPAKEAWRISTSRVDPVAKRALDLVVSAVLLTLLAPLFLLIALLIKLESPGPAFYSCHRAGYRGCLLRVLKFRKMRQDAAGPALTVEGDPRFTRLGRLLAATKLDELPQLVNVLLGQMSLVGPRPEDWRFVRANRAAYDRILSVRPGITGLCQLAFAKEGAVLARADAEQDYVRRLLPQKIQIDLMYAARRSFFADVKILFWTFVALSLRRDIAVDRTSGALSLRASRHPALEIAQPERLGAS